MAEGRIESKPTEFFIARFQSVLAVLSKRLLILIVVSHHPCSALHQTHRNRFSAALERKCYLMSVAATKPKAELVGCMPGIAAKIVLHARDEDPETFRVARHA